MFLQSENEQDVATIKSSRNGDLKQVIYNVKNDNMVSSSADIQGYTRNLKTLNSQYGTAECSEDDSAVSESYELPFSESCLFKLLKEFLVFSVASKFQIGKMECHSVHCLKPKRRL